MRNSHAEVLEARSKAATELAEQHRLDLEALEQQRARLIGKYEKEAATAADAHERQLNDRWSSFRRAAVAELKPLLAAFLEAHDFKTANAVGAAYRKIAVDHETLLGAGPNLLLGLVWSDLYIDQGVPNALAAFGSHAAWEFGDYFKATSPAYAVVSAHDILMRATVPAIRALEAVEFALTHRLSNSIAESFEAQGVLDQLLFARPAIHEKLDKERHARHTAIGLEANEIEFAAISRAQAGEVIPDRSGIWHESVKRIKRVVIGANW